jgi:transposase
MNYFAGIDVSKATLDVSVYQKGRKSLYSKFGNHLKGYKQMLGWLTSHSILLTETLFCLENTGLYSRALTLFLAGMQCKAWVVMPVEIKRSMGLQRGKNDKVDSERIAHYASRHYDGQACDHPQEMMLKLKDWLTFRDRLIKQQQQLQQPINEFADMGLTDQAKEMRKALHPVLLGISKGLKQAELAIKAIIKSEQNIKRLYELMLSVPGVGPITAWYLIAFSNGMRSFDNAKKLACYCGVAPFEHTSGTSIRGRSRVSPMANKQIKKLLHLGAMTIIGNKIGEMYQYYLRKVEQGKNKMSIINALRNKILQRVLSVTKND